MLRQDSGMKDIYEKGLAMAVTLAESEGPVNTEEVITLTGSPAIFCYLAENGDVIGNTGEDLRSGEVYDDTISSDDKRAHGWNCSMGTVMILKRI